MDTILASIPLHLLILACAVAFFAGVIKGTVGFAMPMILISGLSTFLPPELALAGLILPTLITNWQQVLLYDLREAWPTIKRFKVFLIVGGALLLASAQLVTQLPSDVMLVALGAIITCFTIWQLSGRAPAAGSFRQSAASDASVGAIAGLIGGVSGIWGPPTVAYLTAIGTDKRVQMLAQGIIYGLGAIMLTIGHTKSGILNGTTVWVSACLVVPAMLGVIAGHKASRHFDQVTFRRATLIVLTIGGLNLLRRGLMG